MDLVMAIVALCNIHSTSSSAYITAKEQSKCQAYYAECLKKQGINDHRSLLVCITERRND